MGVMEYQEIGADREGDERRHVRTLYCQSFSALLLEHVGVGLHRSRLQAEATAYCPTWEI